MRWNKGEAETAEKSSTTHITENTGRDKEAVLMGRDQEQIWSDETGKRKVS